MRNKYPEAAVFDFLNTASSIRYLKEPWRFRADVLALASEYLSQPIIVDEVQKAPSVLGEIHWLIENKGCSFIMCGSSARQMKRLGVNMLGGRALKYHFFPLVYPRDKG